MPKQQRRVDTTPFFGALALPALLEICRHPAGSDMYADVCYANATIHDVGAFSTVVFPSPGVYITSSFEAACNNTMVVIERGATVASVKTTVDW